MQHVNYNYIKHQKKLTLVHFCIGETQYTNCYLCLNIDSESPKGNIQVKEVTITSMKKRIVCFISCPFQESIESTYIHAHYATHTFIFYTLQRKRGNPHTGYQCKFYFNDCIIYKICIFYNLQAQFAWLFTITR